MYDINSLSYKISVPVSRRITNEVLVGNVGIGGMNPVRIQSMTNTDTMDTKATVEQVLRMVEAGSELVRITAPNVQAAENLYNIKNELVKLNCNVPLIADIHFNPKAAEVAAQVIEKVRINPGNYTDRNRGKFEYTDEEYQEELEKIQERLLPLIEICKKHNAAMRIGTNHGSLSERIVGKYGDTHFGMAMSAMEFIKICNSLDYNKLVLSMKSSNVKVMVYATRILASIMDKEGLLYPIHLGVTEAGDGEDGRIKSAAGIGSLLACGIGDTIRVSLTEDPEKELPVAREIVDAFNHIKVSDDANKIISLSTSYSRRVEKIGLPISQIALDNKPNKENICFNLSDLSPEEILNKINNIDPKSISVSTLEKIDNKYKYIGDLSMLLMEGVVDELVIDDEKLGADILQATGDRIYKAEFISCPSCGRTKYDIQAALKKVKEACSHLVGVKIGVMGCIVNGPGEMADAHYGYVGDKEGKVNLYRGKALVYNNIDENIALERLISMIKEDSNWIEK